MLLDRNSASARISRASKPNDLLEVLYVYGPTTSHQIHDKRKGALYRKDPSCLRDELECLMKRHSRKVDVGPTFVRFNQHLSFIAQIAIRVVVIVAVIVAKFSSVIASCFAIFVINACNTTTAGISPDYRAGFGCSLSCLTKVLSLRIDVQAVQGIQAVPYRTPPVLL
jgi:hypothetical protein